MSKSIFVSLSQINFPPSCVVCLSPASSKYPIQQVYSYGNKTHSITVDVPMCSTHFEAASRKGFAERAMGCLGIVGGILVGIFSVAILLSRWVGGGGIPAKIFVGAAVGFGMFILAWWLIGVQLAPWFALREAKEARNAVRITLVQPFDKRMQVEFQNESVADLLERLN